MLRSRRARDYCKQHAVTLWQVHLKKTYPNEPQVLE
jgi:hypothetical protein